jgi:hypothetical protein
MHAVVVEVTINDADAATSFLNDELVPRVSQAPGFVAGYWVRLGNTGRSVVVFESEDVANTALENIQQRPGDFVTVNSAEVGEVVASA